MSNLLAGLLSTAASFLPGGGIISKLVPGAIDAIGTIANRVINRKKGQGIGSAILEAAPDALLSAAGLAQTGLDHYRQEAKEDGEEDERRRLANKSKIASDHLPIVYGTKQQPSVQMNMNRSGPFAAHGPPPAAAYDEAKGGPTVFSAPQTQAGGIDRTQQWSSGNAPSFNVFDKYRPKEVFRRVKKEEFIEDEDEDEDEEPRKPIKKYIKKKSSTKKSSKKSKRS